MGVGLAWIAPQHGRNRYERSPCEHSHSVPVRGNPCPEAITAGSFSPSGCPWQLTFDGSKVRGLKALITTYFLEGTIPFEIPYPYHDESTV